MQLEEIRRGGRTVNPFGVGADWSSPIVAAVLAYRNAWNPYVTGTLNNVRITGESQSKAGPLLKPSGDNYQALAQTILGEWNSSAGLTPDHIEVTSGITLKGWEDTVKRVGNLAAAVQASQYAPTFTDWPEPPSPDVQRKVLMDLRAVAVDPSFLGTLTYAAGKGLQVVGSGISAAIERVEKVPGEIASKVIPWQLWVVVGVVLVGGVVAVIKIAPVAAAAYLPAPRRPAT